MIILRNSLLVSVFTFSFRKQLNWPSISAWGTNARMNSDAWATSCATTSPILANTPTSPRASTSTTLIPSRSTWSPASLNWTWLLSWNCGRLYVPPFPPFFHTTYLSLQEAFRSVEDIHGLMTMAHKPLTPEMTATYFQRLARIFWVSNNHLFHAYHMELISLLSPAIFM